MFNTCRDWVFELRSGRNSRQRGIGMYLKALEVCNFKSFKGEVTVPLDRGFTAITGPNGSGKSNCGDAIQFVLGPRSNKVIRAQNSKDLIFNGGKNSKPARSCSVTLVFANPILSNGRRRLPLDSDEVRLSRTVRLTKANNVVTQYLLDDVESSQKSFHRLLGAANARPDGYNIVLQGDVTKLAKMTSKERRKVLDGVAGVTSYDDEIRKADKQRGQVEGYIERIAMLEEEQKGRLKELRKEKDLAIKVRDLVAELTESRIISYQAKYASQKSEIAYQVNEQSRYVAESNDLKDEVKQGSKILLGLEDKIGELQKEIEALMGGDNNGLQQQIQQLQVTIATNGDLIRDAEEKDSEDKLELQELLDSLQEANDSLTEFADSLSSARGDLESAKLAFKEAEQEEAAVSKLLESSGESTAQLSRNLSKATENVETCRKAMADAQSEVDRTAAQAEVIEEQLVTAQDAAEEARLAFEELELKGEEFGGGDPEKDRVKLAKELHASQNAESKLTEESQLVENRLRETERKLISARNELETRSGAKGLAGGSAAVIAARDRGELRGIIGTIAELCAPKDDSHEDALSAAIGGGMTSVVVETDEVAANAIKWLSEKRAGRATFLPLNRLANTRAAGKAVMVARKPGVIGFAYELLDYDPRIDIAVRFALRNTLIVDSMSTARANMGGVRLVTLRGDVTETGGAMIGGSKRKMPVSFGGRVQGANEVERLTAEVERLRLMSDTVNGALADARKVQLEVRGKINVLTDGEHASKQQEWRAELKQARTNHNKSLGEVADIERKLSTLESQAGQKLTALDSAQSNFEQSELDRATAQSSLEDASPAHLKERLHEAEVKRLEAQGLRHRAEDALGSGSDHRDLLNNRVVEFGERIASIEVTIVSRSEKIDQMQAAIATDSIELTAKELERSEFLEENQGLENERVQLVEERASLRADLTQKSNDATSRAQMAEEIGRSLSLKQETLDELLSEMSEAEIEPASVDTTLPSVGDAEKKVRGIERRLEGYGPVNMLAIEQYDQCQERLDGMKDDFKTLQTRRKHLLDVTEQLESQRKERLLGVLEKVNENFKIAYEALSDGGRGELFLENPKEPFKGGLELWAQPRGKSAKVTRHQLSGGEQSMAALALIFAIQDYDPSPFYYFDEVDQNLDGFNAERIAKMCRERSKRAQFIMVTLRKVSLRLADHHIGITHGGDGCSRRIVDFDKARALKLGAKAMKEAKAAADKNQSRIDEEAAAAVEMPQVPDSLETPNSLGGLLAHLKDEMSEDEVESSTLASLSERTADMTEDIEERAEVAKAVLAEEEESEVEKIQIATDEEILE